MTDKREKGLPMRRVLSLIAGCFLAAGCTGPGTEFQRSGNPALKLEVRRASTEKVEGWKPTTLKDFQGDHTIYVSPEVELSNDDVISTRVFFNSSGKPKRQRIWAWGAVFLVLSVVLLVECRRRKKWSSGVYGVFFLLLAIGRQL